MYANIRIRYIFEILLLYEQIRIYYFRYKNSMLLAQFKAVALCSPFFTILFNRSSRNILFSSYSFLHSVFNHSTDYSEQFENKIIKIFLCRIEYQDSTVIIVISILYIFFMRLGSKIHEKFLESYIVTKIKLDFYNYQLNNILNISRSYMLTVVKPALS